MTKTIGMLMLAITCCASAQVLRFSTDSAEITIDPATKKITLVNHHPLESVWGFYIKGSKHNIVQGLEDRPVKPGESWDANISHIQGTYTLDGVLFDDWTVEGPNKWGIDKYVRNYLDMRGGKPVTAEAVMGKDSGGSWVWVSQMSKLYEQQYHVKPVVHYESPGVHPAAMPPLSKIVGWGTTLTVNQTNYGAEGPVCYDSDTMPAIYDIECGGTGACTQPNSYMRGKLSVFVYNMAQGHCMCGTLSARAALVNVGTPPGFTPPGDYYIADSFSKSAFPAPFSGYNMLSWMQDSCIDGQTENPGGGWICPPCQGVGGSGEDKPSCGG